MVNVLVRHKVKDFKAWKSAFDGFVEIRRAGGEKSWQVMHPADDPNNLTMLFEWDTLANARTFLNSSELKGAMEKGGVLGAPEVHFLESLGKGEI